jgi:hypothetical protein
VNFGFRNFNFSPLFVFIGAQEGYRRFGIKETFIPYLNKSEIGHPTSEIIHTAMLQPGQAGRLF